MWWNKQDPPVSEEAIRAVGWIVVRTPDGDKICPERAMLSTAHLSFWDVKWAVTERGPALVCGKTTLGYLNDERYVPQAVRVMSQTVPHATDPRVPCKVTVAGCTGDCTLRKERVERIVASAPQSFATGRTPRAHSVARMLREISGGTPMGARLDPITPAMQLVKNMALRNEETLASFKLWADRVAGTFDLIKRVEKAMKSIPSIGWAQVEGTESVIHHFRPNGGKEFRFSVGPKGDPVRHRFNTAREAAEIIERLGQVPKAQSVGGPSWIADKINGIADQMSKMYDGFPENSDMPEFTDMLRTLSYEIRALLTPHAPVSEASAPPPQPEPPAPER